MKLIDALNGQIPDEHELIWDYIGAGELNDDFPITTFNPIKWANTAQNGYTPLQAYNKLADNDQKWLVEQMRKQAKQISQTSYLIVCNDTLLDGWHRAIALTLENIDTAVALELATDD